MTSPGDDTAIVSAMRHALSVAVHGPAFGVNPQVGCVILDAGGRMLAEGWHRGAGTAHAEVDALSKLTPEQTRGATAVVTLEPCNHTGFTGPCSRALIDAGIVRVFYGATDPGPLSGGGAEHLRQAGVEVTDGVLLAEVEEFLHRWLTATRLRRPFVTLKWAASLDGRAAASDAIIVGTGTVLADDPSLTARGDAGELLEHQPIPVVIGLTPVPCSAKLHTHPQPLIQAHSHDLDDVLRGLFERGIRHAFVEGGPTLASSFIAAGLVDEYLVYLAPTLIGGRQLAVGDIGVGTIADARRLSIRDIERVGDDVLIVARPSLPLARPTDAGASSGTGDVGPSTGTVTTEGTN